MRDMLHIVKKYLFLLLPLVFLPFSSAAQDKVALIIGNNAYEGKLYNKLPTCINDAEEMDKCLRALGYTTKLLKDASRQEIIDAFKNFDKQLDYNRAVGVFYYSGHATMIGKDYYLIPAKTKIEENSLKNDAVDISQIAKCLEKKCKLSFLFFDACRDAFPVSDEVFKGTADLRPPSDTKYSGNRQYKCYATEQGDVARSGDDKLSPFTRVLTSHLFDHDSFPNIWSRVICKEVPKLANGQEPKIDQTFDEENVHFCFNEHKIPNPYQKDRGVTINVTPQSKIKFGDKLFDSGKELMFRVGSTYTYTIEHEGYKPYSGSIKVDTNTPPVIDIKLTKIEDTTVKKGITINVTPQSKIKFGDKLFDSGKELMFRVGSTYTYTIEHEGYKPYSGSIKVDTNTPPVIDIKLTKIENAKFKVVCSRPQNAKIYVDDEYKGLSYQTITTTSGSHKVRIVADKYYPSIRTIDLNPGENKSLYVSLTRNHPDWFDFNDYGAHCVSYHFSPKYHVGLSYMYRIDGSRFSFGAMMASSIDFYRGWDLSIAEFSSFGGQVESTITIDDGTGNIVDATVNTSTKDNRINNRYSSDIDPYNEAKQYDANFLFLGNFGFSACNGIMLEAGFGGAYHEKRYYMSDTYKTTKTTITNNLTGELIGEPKYEYDSTGQDQWYDGDSVWSPAIRIGAKFFIPLDRFDDYSIAIGGGYTYLPMNHKFSTWDASVGFCWYF